MLLLLISFVVGFFIAVPTMGPASAIIIRRVVAGNYRKAMAFAAGSILAEGLACLAAIWGVELALYTIPNLKLILEWGGTIILLLVGGYFVLGNSPPKAQAGEVAQPATAKLSGETLGGFAVTAFNPTLIATWTTLFGVVVSSVDVEILMWHRWAIPVAVVLGEATWFAVLVVLARRFGAHVDEWVVDWMLRGIGVILLAIGGLGMVQQVVGIW